MKAKKILLALAILALPAVLFAAEPVGKILLNLKDAEIEGVVKTISELTGKNFILDERVRGKVTVISPTELTPAEAYEVFQAILNVKGFTIVPAADNVFKIVPLAEAKQSNIETADKTSDPGDRLVTRLVTLKNVSPQSIVTVLDQLRSRFGGVTAYEPSNLLIITDANSNIDRLLGIIAALDVPTPGVEMEVFKLKYADAAGISNTVTQALTQTGQKKRGTKAAPMPGQPVSVGDGGGILPKVIPDARTNTLIVIGDASAIADARSLIQTLDVELPSGKGRINVVQLKYASAETMAQVLGSLAQSGQKKAQTPGASGAVQPRAPAIPAPQPAAQPTPATVKTEDLTAQFDEPVTITADKATNSLVIVAQQQDFQTLKAVIDRLDVLRPQVLVEALIMEMSYKKMLELGVEWRTTNNPGSNNPNVVSGTNFGNMSGLANLTTNPFAAPTGMFLAAIDGTVTLGGTTFPNIGALVTALQTKGDVEVLSTPHLLTTDNEEAEIVVSDNLPFKTSTVYDSNGNPRDNFEYKDVGLTLRFTPQINDDDFVKLKVYQETSSVISSTTASQLAPTTTKRTARTTVVVKDGATVVIGGLIQDNKDLNQSQVPCLGDIPLLGALFKNQNNSMGKTNLMIFLTPHVVRDQLKLEKLSRDSRAKADAFAKSKKDVDSMVGGIKDLTGLGSEEKSVLSPDRGSEPKPEAVPGAKAGEEKK